MLWKIIIYFISASLVILSYPKFNLFFLAWFAYVPWFLYLIKGTRYLIHGIKYRVPLIVIESLLFGILVNCGIFYWLVPTFTVAGANFFIAILLYFLLVMYLSLYYAAFAVIFFKLKSKLNNITLIICTASLWVVLEYIRNYMLTGFPWALLGYTQWNNTYLIQISEFTGVYGISFLIVLVNMLLAFKIAHISFVETGQWPVSIYRSYLRRLVLNFTTTLCRPLRRAIDPSLQTLILGIILLIISSYVYGYYVMHKANYKTDISIKCSILQGNIDQYKKFDNKYVEFIKNRYSLLIEKAMLEQPDIILWPETSLPYLYRDDSSLSAWAFDSLIDSKTKNIVGAISKKGKNYYNSAILFNENANELDTYSKKHLVLFGETFPFKRVVEKILPFVSNLGGLTPGKKPGLFTLNDIKFGINICFEVIFSSEFRHYRKQGAGIVANITNDGWYLKTSAPYQHLAFCVFRAIENRCPIIRCANTGISAFIDEKGKIISKLDLYKTGILTDKIYTTTKKTFYTKYGDLFVYVCIGFLIIVILRFKTWNSLT